VLACYDRALEIDARLASAWFNKGDALARLGRFLEARACFENARDLGLTQAAALVARCDEILMNDLYA
jgi:tetratricopeptide (TPR) repeat protein